MDHRMWIIGDPLGARCPDVYCAIKNLRTVIGRLDLLRFAREKNRRAYTSRRANFRRRNFFPSGLRPAKKFNLYERRFPVQLVRCFLEQGETISFRGDSSLLSKYFNKLTVISFLIKLINSIGNLSNHFLTN